MAMGKSSTKQAIKLAALRRDGGTQPRDRIDPDVVTEYRERMEEGDEFPACVAFYDGTDYWLADGFHRAAAAEAAKFTDILCDVRQGTRRDAVLYSVGTNTIHGLRRTNADKRRAVLTLLNDSEWAKWSDREIAAKCGVGNKFVGDVRRSLCSEHSEGRTYTTRHGTVATMNTAAIGHKPEPKTQAEQIAENKNYLDATDPLLAKYGKDGQPKTRAPKADDELDGGFMPTIERDPHAAKRPPPRTFTVILTNDPSAVAATLADRFDNTFLIRLAAELQRFTSGKGAA